MGDVLRPGVLLAFPRAFQFAFMRIKLGVKNVGWLSKSRAGQTTLIAKSTLPMQFKYCLRYLKGHLQVIRKHSEFQM